METEETGQKHRILSSENWGKPADIEEAGQESLRLFAKAHGLLSGIGYSGGRIRSTTSSRTRQSQHIDIRAPGPPRLQQSYPVFDDQSSDVTEAPALLKRGGTAFRKAEHVENLVKARVSCTRKTNRAVSKSVRESQSFRDSISFDTISPEERFALNAKFRECYLEENRKIAEKVEESFRLKDKIGVFDAKVNKTRAETTKTAELNMRIRNKVIPTLKQMREQFISKRKTQPKPQPQRRIPHSKELQNILEAALIDKVRLHPHTVLYNDQDREVANGHLKWLASEGIKRFLPKQKVTELM